MKEYRILEKKYKYRSEFQIQWRTKDADDVLPFTIVHNPWVDTLAKETFESLDDAKKAVEVLIIKDDHSLPEIIIHEIKY